MAYISAYKRRQRKKLYATITRAIALVWLGSFTGLLIAWLGINAIVGCGNVTRTVDGTYLKGQCVLVPWVNPNLNMQ